MFRVIFQVSLIIQSIMMSWISLVLISLINEFIASFKELVIHTNVVTIFTKISKWIIKYYFISDFLWN